MQNSQTSERLEQRAFRLGIAANLFMGLAGIVAALLSHSQALLVDGLFSFVGFVAGLFALRVRKTVGAAPDRARPWGYAADEALFTTFRALSLLGVVSFAILGAAQKIFAYLKGDPIPEIVMGPAIVYFALIGATCFGLWVYFRRAWVRGGRASAMLQLEARSVAFDGLITMIAAAGLIGIYFLRDGPFGVITPIGDALIVVILCLFALSGYWSDFRRGIAELAGVTAAPRDVARIRRALRAPMRDWPGDITDISVNKLGRSFLLAIYFNPSQPLTGAEVDQLTRDAQTALRAEDPYADVYIVISAHGRALPD